MLRPAGGEEEEQNDARMSKDWLQGRRDDRVVRAMGLPLGRAGRQSSCFRASPPTRRSPRSRFPVQERRRPLAFASYRGVTGGQDSTTSARAPCGPGCSTRSGLCEAGGGGTTSASWGDDERVVEGRRARGPGRRARGPGRRWRLGGDDDGVLGGRRTRGPGRRWRLGGMTMASWGDDDGVLGRGRARASPGPPFRCCCSVFFVAAHEKAPSIPRDARAGIANGGRLCTRCADVPTSARRVG